MELPSNQRLKDEASSKNFMAGSGMLAVPSHMFGRAKHSQFSDYQEQIDLCQWTRAQSFEKLSCLFS